MQSYEEVIFSLCRDTAM